MSEFEKAKQYYHHREYQNAIDLILDLFSRNVIENKSIEYPDILCYLGDSRLKLYETSKNKSLVYEALIDFTTGANSLLIFHKTTSDDLNNRIRICTELI
jgi:hypothetical protein